MEELGNHSCNDNTLCGKKSLSNKKDPIGKLHSFLYNILNLKWLIEEAASLNQILNLMKIQLSLLSFKKEFLKNLW